TCPVLLVVGAGDVSTGGAAGAVIMSKNLPKNRLQIFDGVEHAVYVQKQEEFRKLVLEFCREHGIIKGD
ncbi:MAG TPA: alpha/beta hydrolase, partial [Dehalococcoidia bacterium]|nr:alpha/beta hydrolase [Dehalococcoidia bacterium]